MAQRSTGATFAEVMVPVTTGVVILGAIATLIWLTTRKQSGLSGMGSGAPARNVRVNPHFDGNTYPQRLSRSQFTDGDDPGYDLDVEGEDVP